MFPFEIILNIGIHCDEKTMHNLFHTNSNYTKWLPICKKMKKRAIKNRIKILQNQFSKNHFLEDKFKATWLRKVSIPSYHFDAWEKAIDDIENLNTTRDELDVIVSCFRYRRIFRLDNFLL